MRRTLPFVALWFAAGAAATVAWLGVAGERPADRQRRTPTPERQGDAGELAAAEGTPTTTTDRRPPASTDHDDHDHAASPARRSDHHAPAVAPPRRHHRHPRPPVTRTYDLVGGTATLRFSPPA